MNFYNQKGRKKGIYQLRGHIDDDRKHYLLRVKPIFKQLYNIDVPLRDMPSTGVFGFQIWNDELIKFKQSLGLPLGKKLDVSIPPVFLKDKVLAMHVLRGIFDTDGSINLEKKNGKLYPRVYITTICPTLSCQLLNLFVSFGIKATRYEENYKGKFKRQTLYRIMIRGKDMLNLFMELIAPKNPKHLEKYHRFLNWKSL